MNGNFFEEHDFSLWIFAVGTTVIMLMMIGAGIAAAIFVFSLEYLFGDFTPEKLWGILIPIEVILSLSITFTNIIITRGYPKAAKANKAIIYIILACFLFGLLFFDHEFKWLYLSFIALPATAFWLINTTKYKAYLAYFEALHKDPEAFRLQMEKRVS
ncbi:hypothetical protein [Shewanella sp. 10N.286.48.A6]|uniref:hypothetical protein n=1 Tax=Shewanella sp. 10N.286.48.A6 TaxID=1880833 RepID=UPI000C830D47|nr:hypothetical protein [Shewanella sp. 10N.286.48.A6]PMH97057.1 hypothetical protein BCU55_18910 [Shewanella sp. 10N.286.48.A6]